MTSDSAYEIDSIEHVIGRRGHNALLDDPTECAELIAATVQSITDQEDE